MAAKSPSMADRLVREGAWIHATQKRCERFNIESNLISSNTDGSFIMADSNSLRNSSDSSWKRIFKEIF